VTDHATLLGDGGASRLSRARPVRRPDLRLLKPVRTGPD